MIAPSLTFTCNGRVTSVTASLVGGALLGTPGTELPVFQVWHPVLPGSSVYSIVGQVQFNSGVHLNSFYYISTVLLAEDDRIEFQSGDVIACYQPTNPLRGMQLIDASSDANYTAYINFGANLNATTIDINGTDYIEFAFQPLINITTGKYM